MRFYDKDKFSEEVISRFLKLYGSFKNEEQLTKKEFRGLEKIKKYIVKKEIEKEKKKLKKRPISPTTDAQTSEFSDSRPKPLTTKLPRKTLSSSLCKQRIVIDLSYMNENIMAHKDLRMCAKQVTRVYSENRKLPNPLQLHLTSVTDKATEILSYNLGFKNWDIYKHNQSYLETFEKKDVVYLTSDSENVIETFDVTKVYVIGGLLDHNSKKGLSLSRANEHNVSHGRLPINEYMEMKKLKVLPINHVYSIISSVVNGLQWTEAFMNTIPQRKEAKPKIFTNNQLNPTEDNNECKDTQDPDVINS